MRRPTRQVAHNPVPEVNLLSPWALDALANRRLRQRFVAAATVLVMLIGAGWGVQHLRVRQAEQVLTVEQAQTARLTAETTRLAPVRTYVATVGQQKALVQTTMANEVLLSRVLTGLEDATPGGVHVESVSVTVTPPPPPAPAPAPDAASDSAAESTAETAPAPVAAPVTPSACPGPDPFHTRVVIGCITLSGTAASRAAVGDLVINLGDGSLFVEPFISTTTTAEGTEVSFTGTVGLATKALSGRYDDIDALLRSGARR